ncbi:MAG: DUF1080 domain-containing protein [Candidatus Solibacter sp.]|nr:DUF1080 domain-containing protein [Candidatus Solibacter sp.]
MLPALAGGAEPGFKRIFDGKTLEGWRLIRGRGRGYVVEDGILVCPRDGGGNLFTEAEYADFILRLEWRLWAGGNNGIGIRAPFEGDAAFVGMEIQVLDDNGPMYKDLKPGQYTGSVYDVAAARRGFVKPAGEWNRFEIHAEKRIIRVTLNGELITDADLSRITDPKILARHPGLARTSGHIGLLGHGTRVEFRKLRVKTI